MRVDLITEPDSDLKVVNAARCSFDRQSEWSLGNVKLPTVPMIEGQSLTEEMCIGGFEKVLQQKDVKLIKYLAAHKHWSPFAHCQEAFEISINDFELLQFFLRANLSGFEWVQSNAYFWKVRGSLYAWLTNSHHLPLDISRSMRGYLYAKYPMSYIALMADFDDKNLGRHVAVIGEDDRTEDELCTYTLRLHVPIFVKRQLETHRRNFVMTDIEDFAQNEVSRRYVDSVPEIYVPEVWRMQSENKKQGSDGMLDAQNQYITDMDYEQMKYSALHHYKSANAKGVAREQSRMFLPLSTYTDFWFTASLKSWKRLFTLRLAKDAQSETQEVAQMCYEVIKSTGCDI